LVFGISLVYRREFGFVHEFIFLHEFDIFGVSSVFLVQNFFDNLSQPTEKFKTQKLDSKLLFYFDFSSKIQFYFVFTIKNNSLYRCCKENVCNDPKSHAIRSLMKFKTEKKYFFPKAKLPLFSESQVFLCLLQF